MVFRKSVCQISTLILRELTENIQNKHINAYISQNNTQFRFIVRAALMKLMERKTETCFVIITRNKTDKYLRSITLGKSALFNSVKKKFKQTSDTL